MVSNMIERHPEKKHEIKVQYSHVHAWVLATVKGLDLGGVFFLRNNVWIGSVLLLSTHQHDYLNCSQTNSMEPTMY